MSKDITPFIEPTKKWLGKDGIKFFRDVKENYGEINAVWMEGQIPYSVHFREGMTVRNFMRSLEYEDWCAHDYDNNWIELIEECINGNSN